MPLRTTTEPVHGSLNVPGLRGSLSPTRVRPNRVNNLHLQTTTKHISSIGLTHGLIASGLSDSRCPLAVTPDDAGRRATHSGVHKGGFSKRGCIENEPNFKLLNPRTCAAGMSCGRSNIDSDIDIDIDIFYIDIDLDCSN